MAQPPFRPSANPPPAANSAADIAAFLAEARAIDPAASGRLLFALDATLSRQPTWDRAMTLQAGMFDEVAKSGAGRLRVQLIYFRGAGECRASRWVLNAAALRDLMTGIACRGGNTQIAKVLAHANRESAREKIDALVYVGDAMEESADRLCALAGELALRGTKVFLFQEGDDAAAAIAFGEIARITGGAHCRLGSGSAAKLADLLRAVAVYASGGRRALAVVGGEGARLLLGKMGAERR
jgi:hypothetical protein